ncbi:hypothetical protein [Rossellomorea vietnamensis]|uniref:hypothetical protein n=1 Tax=Rossellomorea vietnamensis TaxID=218284 RepID=UPI001653DDE6|nr:hypothetical protein [Rossellomorea vietnamensis]
MTNPLVPGRWSWTEQKLKRPFRDVRILGPLHEIKESRRAERFDDDLSQGGDWHFASL